MKKKEGARSQKKQPGGILDEFRDDLAEIKTELQDELQEWLSGSTIRDAVISRLEEEERDIHKKVNRAFSFLNRRVDSLEAQAKKMAEWFKERESVGKRVAAVEEQIRKGAKSAKPLFSKAEKKVEKELSELRKRIEQEFRIIGKRIDQIEEDLVRNREVIILPEDGSPFTKAMKDGIEPPKK